MIKVNIRFYVLLAQGHPQIVLDKYIIKTQIGEGGCGKVYCGYDRANGYRKVAIKCLGREERSFAEPSEDYQAAEFMNEVVEAPSEQYLLIAFDSFEVACVDSRLKF